MVLTYFSRLQTGSRARKYKVSDRGASFIEYGKIESNRPMWDVKAPLEEEESDSGRRGVSERPWDNWDEWEHR